MHLDFMALKQLSVIAKFLILFTADVVIVMLMQINQKAVVTHGSDVTYRGVIQYMPVTESTKHFQSQWLKLLLHSIDNVLFFCSPMVS